MESTIQTTTPPTTAPMEPVQTPVSTNQTTAQYASLGKRVTALIIDSFLSFFVLGFIIAILTGSTTSDGFALNGLPAFGLFGVMLLYFIGMEGTKGATLGKMLMKIKVVKEDGSACDVQAAAIRNVLRFVDYFFFCLVGIISIAKSSKKQRVGDMAAHTIVVNA